MTPNIHQGQEITKKCVGEVRTSPHEKSLPKNKICGRVRFLIHTKVDLRMCNALTDISYIVTQQSKER